MTLSRFIAGQSAEGFWSQKSLIDECLKNQINLNCLDAQLSNVDETEKTKIVLTLAALYILKELYFEEEQKWTMIASKAKKYLQVTGKVDTKHLSTLY